MAMLQIISAACLRQWGEVHSRTTRQTCENDLYLPPGVKLNIYRNTLQYSGAQIWNDLPANVKQVPYVKLKIHREQQTYPDGTGVDYIATRFYRHLI